MQTLSRLYHPITGTPFQDDETYREVAPCPALAPYIRCFWGSAHPLPDHPHQGGIVIPDTCMDLIFHVDYANNRISSSFCALDEHSSLTGASNADGGLSATFAIRFYAWTACVFAEDTLHASLNGRYPAGAFFPRLQQALTPQLFDLTTLDEKVLAAERVLLSLLTLSKADPAVLNAIHHMLHTRGRSRICEVSAALALSPRQLERRFQAMLGASPKTVSSLLRYQLLWQDMVLNPRFDPLDAVAKYGYADQAHLLHDFRQHHLLSPRDALALARR